MSTEQMISEIIKIITATGNVNKETFSIIMPNGEKKDVLLKSSETLRSLGRKLDDRFGRDCLLFGLKCAGRTTPPPTDLKVGEYNKPSQKRQLSVIYKSSQ